MTSEPVLRRSTRNAAKRDISTVEATAPQVLPKKKRAVPVAKAVSKAKATVEKSLGKQEEAPTVVTKEQPKDAPILSEGDALPETLPTIQSHTGEDVKLHELVAKSDKGIVVFAYPKASTPGCTTQACLFRDNNASFRDAGYAIYGLSGDKPDANKKFQTKQNLTNIVLLCDPTYELHQRLGIKKNPGKGTIRSVIVIQKTTCGSIILKKSPASPALSLTKAQEAIGISKE